MKGSHRELSIDTVMHGDILKITKVRMSRFTFIPKGIGPKTDMGLPQTGT